MSGTLANVSTLLTSVAAPKSPEIAGIGGNAVDCALAAALVSINTQPGVCALAGSAYVTVWQPGGSPVTIDGNVDAIVANRVLPEEARSDYFDRWFSIQAGHLKTARSAFEPLPFFEAPLFDREMVGTEMLDEFAERVFGETDPTEGHGADDSTAVDTHGTGRSDLRGQRFRKAGKHP